LGTRPEKGTLAKWDETPEPVETNPVTGQVENPPNLVPATFYLPLHGGDEYTVPILIDWTASGPRLLDIFCGWWYIEAQPDPYRLRVEPGDTVQVKIQGMPWEGGWFRVAGWSARCRFPTSSTRRLGRKKLPSAAGRLAD
jgi:hypothetical protein